MGRIALLLPRFKRWSFKAAGCPAGERGSVPWERDRQQRETGLPHDRPGRSTPPPRCRSTRRPTSGWPTDTSCACISMWRGHSRRGRVSRMPASAVPRLAFAGTLGRGARSTSTPSGNTASAGAGCWVLALDLSCWRSHGARVRGDGAAGSPTPWTGAPARRSALRRRSSTAGVPRWACCLVPVSSPTDTTRRPRSRRRWRSTTTCTESRYASGGAGVQPKVTCVGSGRTPGRRPSTNMCRRPPTTATWARPASCIAGNAAGDLARPS